MGHAGAIVGGAAESAKGKSEILKRAGVEVVETIEEIPKALEYLK